MKKSLTYELIINCLLLCLLPIVSALFLAQFEFEGIVIVIVTVPTIVLTSWMVFFIRNRVTKPLKLLSEKADTIAMGDLSQPIHYNKNDELGNFVSSFDGMRKQLEQLQQKQKVFEIEREHFITSISHDMKTPIASISAYVEALQDGMANSKEEEEQYFQIIESKLALLTELSKQLRLSYVSKEEIVLNLKKVNCYEWTTHFFINSRSECSIRSINLHLENGVDEKSDTHILIDVNQLNRAIQNILSNSFRYTKKKLSLFSKLDSRYFYLFIENDGCSLNTKNVEQIFERFYTEDYSDSKGHLGLGLSIAKTIIQSMNGDLTAQVDKDRITFKLRFPIYYEHD